MAPARELDRTHEVFASKSSRPFLGSGHFSLWSSRINVIPFGPQYVNISWPDPTRPVRFRTSPDPTRSKPREFENPPVTAEHPEQYSSGFGVRRGCPRQRYPRTDGERLPVQTHLNCSFNARNIVCFDVGKYRTS